MDSMKTAVRKVSEVVFPGIKSSYQQPMNQRDQIMSSLPLQMCLYFNVNYSPLWFIIRIGCLIYKFTDLIQLYKILLTAIMIVMFLVEISRLYLGYAGNLQEKVPELAGFWMLTAFLQFPLHSLCTFSIDFIILPWERVVDVILMVFILLEIVIGYFAVKKISNHQALKMKIQLMKYNVTNQSTETFVE